MTKTMKRAMLLQRVYCACSLVVLLAMPLFTRFYPSKISSVCMLISVLMLLTNVVNPMGLTGALMSVAGCIRQRVKEGKWPPAGVMLRAAADSMLAFVCGTAAIISFVERTGGV